MQDNSEGSIHEWEEGVTTWFSKGRNEMKNEMKNESGS
jgi:hypothetical protein